MSTAPPPGDTPRPVGPEVLPEIRARRLVIVDERGDERIVAEVTGDTAVVEVSLPSNFGKQASIVLVACPEVGDGIGPGVGVQGWAEDDQRTEVNLWQEADGRWAVTARAGGPEGRTVRLVPER